MISNVSKYLSISNRNLLRRKAYASLGDRVASEHDILAEAGTLLSAVSGAGTTGSAALVLVGASLLALTPAAVV